MRFPPLALLLLVFAPAARAQEEPTAEEFFRKVEEHHAGATTFSFSGTVRIVPPGGSETVELAVEAWFKEPNRARFSTTGKLKQGEKTQELSNAFVCDGKRMHVTSSQGRSRLDDAPETLGMALRMALVRGGQTFAWRYVDDPEAFGEIALSGFRFGEDEEVGDRRVKLVHYELKFRWHDREDSMTQTVKVDPESLAILAREIAPNDGAKIVENSGPVRFDEEIPDSEFALPE